MIETFIKIFEFRKSIVDEPMDAISTVLAGCDNLIPIYFPRLKAYFIVAFSNPEEINSLIASLHCLSVVCDCEDIELFGHDNGTFCDKIVHCFFQILQVRIIQLTNSLNL